MQVTIHDATISKNGKRIDNLIEADESLKQYFIDLNFYAEYEEDISTVPLSILNIPALSTILHFAVAIGADINIGEVDENYLKGADSAQRFLKNCIGFNQLKCTAKIHAKPIKNIYKDYPYEKGLLFSGGSDSTSSYIGHRYENPKLIIIWGLDIPTSWPEFWHKIEETYKAMRLYKIKTNSEDLYRTNSLCSLGSALTEGYRPTYSFSVNALGVCAPLTVVENIGLLMLSSTYPSREYHDPNYPWTKNRPSFIVNQFWKWGGTRCREIDHEYSTTEKIKYFLKPYFEQHGPMFLRSCGNRQLLTKNNLERLNCCECDKCQRVIGMLIVNGIDPRVCGFPTTGMTYAKMRSDIETRKWNPVYLKYHWQEVKEAVPIIKQDFGGSWAFLEWLRKYNFW